MTKEGDTLNETNSTWLWAYNDLQKLRQQLAERDLLNKTNSTWLWAYNDLQKLKQQLAELDDPMRKMIYLHEQKNRTPWNHETTPTNRTTLEKMVALSNNESLHFVLTWLGIFAAVVIGIDGIFFAFYSYKRYQMTKIQQQGNRPHHEAETEDNDFEDSGHFSTDIASWNADILEDP